jgi:PAS domain S-box-containing protein/putative nucleotidyltransferase with HDIG domain
MGTFSLWFAIIIIAFIGVILSNRRRHQAEKSAEEYLDVAGVMFVALDTDGLVTLINRKGCEILDYEYDEVIGKNWFENFLPENIRDEVALVGKKLFKGEVEVVEYFENPVLTKSGEERIVAWHNTILRGSGGNITGVLSSGEDITDRKQAEEALNLLFESSTVKIGPEFFDSVSENLAGWLGADCVMLSEYLEGNKARVISMILDGKRIEDYSYDLNGTPCADAKAKEFCFYPSGVKESFPEDRDLVELGAEAYVGMAIKDLEGTPVGVLCAISRNSLTLPPGAKEVFTTLAVRISVELERKQAEEELLLQSEMMKRMTEGVYLVRMDGIIVYTNPKFEQMFGYESGEMLGKHASIVNYPTEQSPEETTREILEVLDKEGEWQGEMQNVRKDGTPFWSYASIVSFDHSEHGKVLVAIHSDITERKRTEEGRYLLSIMTEQISNSVITTDLDFKVTYANRAFQEIFGYTQDEIIGKSPDILNVEPDAERIQQEIYEVVSSGKAWSGEMLNRRKDGTQLYIYATIYPLIDKQGKIIAYAGIQQDITERKRAEEQIRQETELTKNLLRLSEATSKTADIDTLMESVVGISREIIGADIVLSYLWDGATSTFRPCSGAGLANEMQPLFKTTPVGLGNALIKEIMGSGNILIDLNTAGAAPLKLQQNGLFNWVEDIEMISLLPLVGKREYLGLIVCICIKGCGCIKEKHQELMQAIANQVSTALEEALHYKESINRAMELSQKVETIETMSEISKSILSTLNVAEIFEVTARMVSRLVACDWVRVIEVDRDKEEFEFKAGFEEGGTLENMIVPFASTSLTEVVDTKRPEYISDLRKVSSPLAIERELTEQGYLSVLRAPVIVKGEVTGVLGLMSRRTSAFNPADLSTLEKIATQVGVALENARLVTDLEEFSVGAVKALAETIDAKSPWTRGHSERVTTLALKIGKEMGLGEEDLREFRIAGLLHDIGKIGTNMLILDKPESLTDEEYDQMKEHPGKGVEILSPIKQLSNILPVIRGHHECYDGTGYPDGLKGAEIPFRARILTVADTVDAMGADRPYRKGLSEEKIIKELKRCSGTQFDPEVVTAYLKTLEE